MVFGKNSANVESESYATVEIVDAADGGAADGGAATDGAAAKDGDAADGGAAAGKCKRCFSPHIVKNGHGHGGFSCVCTECVQILQIYHELALVFSWGLLDVRWIISWWR